jgi:hypothetical protein
MAGEITTITRPEQVFKGLSLRASDLLRDPHSATEAINVVFTDAEGFGARPGYRGLFTHTSALGVAKYIYQDATTGADTVEKLLIGANLHRIDSGSLNLTYIGAGVSVYCDCYAVGTEWLIRLVVDDVVVYSKSLGLGFDEVSPVTINTVRGEIDALADFTATLVGTDQAAAFLPTLVMQPFSSGALSISYEYKTQVNQPSSAPNPFAGAYAARNTSSFEFPTTCNGSNLIYLGSRYDDEVKYDGQKVYRSGLPKPSTPSASVIANATGRTGTNIRYRVSFVQVDKRGNRHEGIISDESGTVSPSADFVDVTYSSLANTSGFNTDYAQVNGGQVSVTTITVDSGHTLKVGDVAYFYDSISASYVEKTITAITATTIAFTGAVTVADNDPISANLRVAVYTQLVTSGDYYLVREYPHNSSAASPVVRDLGNTLGAQYVFPVDGSEPGLPPRGQYRAIYRGLKFISGVLGSGLQDGAYYSDISSLESFPPTANSFDVKTNRQSKHSGLFPTNDYLLIGKSTSTHVLVGDNDENGFFQYKVDDLSLAVGVDCHHSFQQIEDGSVVWANQKGLFITKAGSLPREISQNISPAFKTIGSDSRLKTIRSFSAYDPLTNRYYIYIPAEETSGGKIYANTRSKLFLFDFSRMNEDVMRITEFSNVNAGCGFIVNEESIYFCEKRLSPYTSDVESNVYKFQNTKTSYDQVDHSASLPGILMNYGQGWEDGGDPSTFKSPLRLKVFATDPLYSPQYSLTVQTEINFVSNAIATNTFNFGSVVGAAGYDLDPYDVAPYDSTGEPELDQRLVRFKCKSWRYRFLHSTRYELPVISGWESEVALPYDKRMKE